MAAILIIEDRASDRKLLATILHTRGHEILAASDGEEALRLLAETTPDLIISDILMPSVDGYEFVRRMREKPSLAAIPVVFYTATYHEREARVLARQCGVFDVLTKPSAPRVILSTVDAALASRATDGFADVAQFVEQQGPAAPAAAQMTRADADTERLSAVVEVGRQIVAEQNPVVFLNTVCWEARAVTLARHAVLGLVGEPTSENEMLFTCGLDQQTTVNLTPSSLDSAVIRRVVEDRRPVRARNPEGRPETLGLPANHPPVSSILTVPIASSAQVYGWLSLQHKLGADEFTAADEHAAMTLGAHAGIAYENARTVGELRRRVALLEQAQGQMAARAEMVREEERVRLSRTLHDQLGQALTGVKLDLAWLAAELRSQDAVAVPPALERIASMAEGIDTAIRTVRELSAELRPAVLGRLGLLAAIEAQAEQFERRSGIRCRVHLRVQRADLDPGRALSVVRIVDEALTNVLRHARATRVTVVVRGSARWLTVSIVDNGRGISRADLVSSQSLGLMGMRERAVLLGGHLNVGRRRTAGTVVELTLPLVERRRESRE